jgi:hypothetical protein
MQEFLYTEVMKLVYKYMYIKCRIANIFESRH